MKQLYLHVGTHKTGTTSFQACLLANRAALAQGGVAVLSETDKQGQRDANCAQLANALLRPSLNSPVRMTGYVKRPGFWQVAKATARVQRFLRSAGATRFVISAEAFCFAREDSELKRIASLFRRPDLRVTPVICFRREADWRESWRAHLTKWEPAFRRPYGTGTDDIRQDWYFDRAAIAAFWQQLGDVRSVDYDAALAADGTVIPALLRAMEIELAEEEQKIFLNTRT